MFFVFNPITKTLFKNFTKNLKIRNSHCASMLNIVFIQLTIVITQKSKDAKGMTIFVPLGTKVIK